ncbi:hypothetical protein, partial [Parasutterella excrementihominis]
MKELTLKKSLFSIFILLPISILMSGYVIKYGWNEIISTINGISSITFKQAIGIDIVASFILASRRTKDD